MIVQQKREENKWKAQGSREKDLLSSALCLCSELTPIVHRTPCSSRMMGDFNVNIGDEQGNNIVEDVSRAMENSKQTFNLIRSQRLLSESVYLGGLPTAKSGVEETDSDTERCIKELEDNIDRFCIQEDALQFSLENDTIKKIRSYEATSSELQELLELHFRQEVGIKSMAIQLFQECFKLQDARNNLTQVLEDYMAHENKRIRQLKENYGSEDKETMQKLKKQLTEIRFMQLLIPRMVSQWDGELSKTEWLRKLCQEVRTPVLSLDDLE